MLTRAITGSIYVACIVAAVLLGGFFLQAFFAIIGILMLQEFYRMFKKSVVKPQFILATLIGFVIYLLAIVPAQFTELENKWTPALGAAVIGFILICAAELPRKTNTPLQNISISIFGIIYIVLPLIFINELSAWGKAQVANQLFPLMAIFILIWTFDTFAYLTGRKLGKTKLAEKISPNKSWEGFAGGLIFTLIASILIAYFLDTQPYLKYGIIGVLVALFATIGDLIESMIKRSLNLKDSGNILPGHGGLLDRLDSVLIVVPVIFIFEMIWS